MKSDIPTHQPKVFDPRLCGFAESPLWHPSREELFWVDIRDQKVLSRKGEATREFSFDEMVSAIGWVDDDSLLIALESGLYRLNLKDGLHKLVVAVEADQASNRSNDGRADPWNGFWISTMDKDAKDGAGSIYRYFKGELRQQVADLSIPNGLCFDRNRQIGYYTDSATKLTWRFSLDANGWMVGEAEVFLDFTDQNLTVDGAIIDTEGCMIVAMCGDGHMLKFSPEGKVLERFEVHTPFSTCPAFGGGEFTDLFVTTGALDLDANVSGLPPHGATLVFRDCVRGVGEPKVVVRAAREG